MGPFLLRCRPSQLAGLCALATAVLLPAVARAHFILNAPASWQNQDAYGLPEKLGPCGNEYDAGLTGIVTNVAPGGAVTVTINEVIFHPGHYRIALSLDGGFPPEPVVTPNATSPCGTAAIESPAVFPVLADDVFDHTTQFTTPQSVQVTLPPGVTCDQCTLQVIEFMSDHGLNNPGGCFYHHCANLSIFVGGDGGITVTDSGTPGGGSGGGGPDGGRPPGSGVVGPVSGACGCSGASGGIWAALGLASAFLVSALSRRRDLRGVPVPRERR